MDDKQQLAIDIAVHKVEMNGLREQQKAHAEATNKRLEDIEKKLDLLVAAFNRGKGAWAVAVILSGLFGAAIAKLLGFTFGAITK